MKKSISDLIGLIQLPHKSEHYFVESCKIKLIEEELILYVDKGFNYFDKELNYYFDEESNCIEVNSGCLRDTEVIENKLYKNLAMIELINILEFTEEIDWNNLDKNIDDDKLLKWCKKYKTLPYSSQNSIKQYNSISGINYNRLCEEILSLAAVWHLWLLTVNVDSEIKSTKRIINAPEDIESLFWHANNNCYKDIDKNTYVFRHIENCMQSIRFVLDCIMQPKSTYYAEVTDTGFQIFNTACGIMDLFFINIYTLMSKKEIFQEGNGIDINGKSIRSPRICRQCGKEFWPVSKSPYCVDCNRKNNWYYNHKDELKEKRKRAKNKGFK